MATYPLPSVLDSPQGSGKKLCTIIAVYGSIYCSVFADCSIEKYSHFYNLKSVVFFADCIVFAYITVVFTVVLLEYCTVHNNILQ